MPSKYSCAELVLGADIVAVGGAPVPARGFRRIRSHARPFL